MLYTINTVLSKFGSIRGFRRLTSANTETIHRNVFLNPRITTEFYKGTDYETVGLYHVTDTQGVHLMRVLGTELSNMFGGKGYETEVYDDLRKETLSKVNAFLTENPQYRITGVRMEFEQSRGHLLIHNLYGTLQKKRFD